MTFFSALCALILALPTSAWASLGPETSVRELGFSELAVSTLEELDVDCLEDAVCVSIERLREFPPDERAAIIGQFWFLGYPLLDTPEPRLEGVAGMPTLKELGLGSRHANRLSQAGYQYLKDVARMTQVEIESVPGLDHDGVSAVLRFLRSKGFVVYTDSLERSTKTGARIHPTARLAQSVRLYGKFRPSRPFVFVLAMRRNGINTFGDFLNWPIENRSHEFFTGKELQFIRPHFARVDEWRRTTCERLLL